MGANKSIIFTLMLLAFFGNESFANLSKRFEALTGVTTRDNPKRKWDKKFSSSNYIFGKTPAKFLAENHQFIPKGGTVLDMGMGEGRNAVFLARKGYKVTGVDISSVAIRKAQNLAKEFEVRINTLVASMHDYNPKPASFDAIICYYYVDRELNEKIMKWLKPGGILIYEAHTYKQRKNPGFQHYKKEYLLRPGELLSLFKGGDILKYEEPLHESEYRASLILQKH